MISLQTISSPHYELIINVNKDNRLSIDGYDYVLDYVGEIDPLEYEDGELDESLFKPINYNFDSRVEYIYVLNAKSWLVFDTEYLFLWSKSNSEWQLRVGINGYASLDEIYDLKYLSNNVIEKAEELRRLGNPSYWTKDLSRAIYSISFASGELFFLYSGGKWRVSFDRKNWDDAVLVSKGEGKFVKSLKDFEREFVGSLESLNFKEGMNILNSRTVHGRLDYLFE